jgi:hypothetical protein
LTYLHDFDPHTLSSKEDDKHRLFNLLTSRRVLQTSQVATKHTSRNWSEKAEIEDSGGQYKVSGSCRYNRVAGQTFLQQDIQENWSGKAEGKESMVALRSQWSLLNSFPAECG